MKTVFIYTASWVGLVFLAILNGSIRQKMYSQYMTDLSAHQLSTFIFVILIAAYLFLISGVVRLQSSKQALLVGSIWVVMTISFEFIFGHYIMGNSWTRLLDDYNLIEGRLWILILIWTYLSPYTFYRIRS